MRIEIDHDIFEMRLGTFYRYTNKEQFVALKSDIGVSNGLTWNEVWEFSDEVLILLVGTDSIENDLQIIYFRKTENSTTSTRVIWT